ncbi:MAG: hypothetical protein KF787_06440 [Phycisphaeraceae bacterium]|nr:hypothetical protein [Phycisphaerae bacterium]MBX3392270.1 hypothetical protein [Phycisphaeraceae bacterium]
MAGSPITRPPRMAIASVASLLPLAGCVSDNDRLTIGQEVKLEVFSTGPDDTAPVAQGGSLVPEENVWTVGRTPQSIDRSGWERTEFVVPVDGTGHRPTYTAWVMLKNSTARQRGDFPTAESALELTGGFTDEQFTESWTAPLVTFGSVFAIPFRLFIEPPWTVRRSPAMGYERWRGAGQAGLGTSGEQQGSSTAEASHDNHSDKAEENSTMDGDAPQ